VVTITTKRNLRTGNQIDS